MNWRLENPPLIDVSVSQHMGLFAVARLAARSGVRIRLRSATPQGLSALVWLPSTLAGQETARDGEERSRRLAEGASLSSLRAGGRRPRGDLGQSATAARGGTHWFRAQRSSERRAQGTSPSSSVLGAVDSAPATGQGGPTTPAWRAFGTPVPGPSDDVPATGTAHPPVTGDRTVAGLPMRRPGANLFPGSVGGTAASDPVLDETRAPGSNPESRGTGRPAGPPRQAPPLNRSPEKARSRLSGFQLGSHEAETGTPGAGEEASR